MLLLNSSGVFRDEYVIHIIGNIHDIEKTSNSTFKIILPNF